MHIAFTMELMPMLYSLFFDRLIFTYILLVALKASVSPNGAYYNFLKVKIEEIPGWFGIPDAIQIGSC